MSGVSTHAIRKWEERYGLVEPARSTGGERRYSFEEIERLGLCAKLSKAGYELASLADHPTEALRILLDQLPSVDLAESASADSPERGQRSRVSLATPSPERAAIAADRRSQQVATKPSVLVLGNGLRDAIDKELRLPALVDWVYPIDADLPTTEVIAQQSPVDVVIMAVDSLQQEGVDEASLLRRRWPPLMVLVVYKFGLAAYVEELRGHGVSALRGPLAPVELQRFALGLAAEQRCLAQAAKLSNESPN